MPRRNKRHVKQPTIEASGPVGPPPQLPTQGSTNGLPPVFELNLRDRHYCLDNCQNRDQQAAFAKTLHKLSQLTWGQIMGANRKGVGTETIRRDQLHAAVPPWVTPDVELLALRFSGKHPMVGFRLGRVLTILWLDVDMTLYNHD